MRPIIVLFEMCCVLITPIVFSTSSQAEVIRIVTGNDYQPYTNETLPDGGLSTKIVKRVLDETGLDYEVSFLTWSRGIEETRVGARMATFPYLKNPQREKDFLFSDPIHSIANTYFIKKDRLSEFKKQEDVYGKLTCQPKGQSYGKVLSTMIEKGLIKTIEAASLADCFKMVQHSRIDFFAWEERTGWYAATEVFGPEVRKHLRTVDFPIGVIPLHLMFTKNQGKSSEVMGQFNKALKKLKENGTIDEIMRTYDPHAN